MRFDENNSKRKQITTALEMAISKQVGINKHTSKTSAAQVVGNARSI
jgi:hypothetical protein